MATITMTEDSFPAAIQKSGIVFIDFWAAWCGPCRNFAPVFEAAAKKHPDITWAKVDTEAEQNLAGALKIRSIPTLMVFRDGILLMNQAGALPGPALDDIVTKVRALDMDVVRQKLKGAEVA